MDNCFNGNTPFKCRRRSIPSEDARKKGPTGSVAARLPPSTTGPVIPYNGAMITIPYIADILAPHLPLLVSASHPGRSAVALIMRDGTDGPEILFIRRAADERDPWSGNLAFPGGRIDPGDLSPRHAAERETWEETGLRLQETRLLGRLDDVTGAHLPVLVSCFVYALSHDQPLCPNREVAEAFWIPLTKLLDADRHTVIEVAFGGQQFLRPAIPLLPGRPVLWGITYRLVMQFLNLLFPGRLPLREDGLG